MYKREAKFGTFFRHYIKAHPLMSGAFELKQTGDNSIPFSYVSDHQIEALLAVKHGKIGLLYKAPDDSAGVKPFDYFYLRNAAAWVVIRFPKAFHIIDIDAFLLEKERSARKSLTNGRAEEISTWTVFM